MKKNIQKLKALLAVSVVALLMSAAAAPAFAARAPRDPGTLQALDIAHIGAKACRVDNSTTSKQCASGSGMLYALCSYGTTAVAGKGSVAFDTVTAADIAGFASLLAISPIVYGTNVAGLTGNDAVMPKCWAPPVPVRFEGGLVVKQDDTGHDTLALYRLDSGVNP